MVERREKKGAGAAKFDASSGPFRHGAGPGSPVSTAKGGVLPPDHPGPFRAGIQTGLFRGVQAGTFRGRVVPAP
jgi:hypothetical protein